MISAASILKVPYVPYVVGVALVSAILYVTSLRVQVLSLENDLAHKEVEVLKLQQKVRLGDIQYLELGESLKVQNLRVQELERLGVETKAETQNLLVRLRKETEGKQLLIARLKLSEARTCEEGVQLIDEALGL